MAKKAMKKMNKHELNGRTIGVQEALDQDRDKFGYIVKDAGIFYMCRWLFALAHL
jgi:hypothetical protein